MWIAVGDVVERDGGQLKVSLWCWLLVVVVVVVVCEVSR